MSDCRASATRSKPGLWITKGRGMHVSDSVWISDIERVVSDTVWISDIERVVSDSAWISDIERVVSNSVWISYIERVVSDSAWISSIERVVSDSVWISDIERVIGFDTIPTKQNKTIVFGTISIADNVEKFVQYVRKRHGDDDLEWRAKHVRYDTSIYRYIDLSIHRWTKNNGIRFDFDKLIMS